jgi:PAS domain S-box-containing protein
MTLTTVKVPEQMEPAFTRAEELVSDYFSAWKCDPPRGTIEIYENRYIMIRGASLSIEFFNMIRELYGESRENEAEEFARNILFDLSHAIGKSDARDFHEKMNLEDPIERLSAGPVHFSHTGWAFVDVLPESNPTPDENYYLIFDHPYSFESDAWIQSQTMADFPVCIMNAGYSSGWCEESFGVPLVSTEILCRAKGDPCCRFIMAHPEKITGYVNRYVNAEPKVAKNIDSYQIPNLFARKRIEEELRESESRYKGFSELTLEGIAIHDQGVLIDFNPAFARILGYEKDELIKRNAIEMIVLPEYREMMHRKIMEGCETPYEIRLNKKDGTIITAEVEARQIQHKGKTCRVASIRDITERKIAEERLRFTQFAVDRLMDGAFWMGPDARFVYVNDAACRSLGYTREELLTMSAHDIDPSFTPDAWQDHWREIKECGSFTMETRHRAKDGRVFPVEVTVNYMQFEGKEYNCAFVRNITERKRIEKEKVKLEEQLNQSLKMEGIGRLAGGVAHDFNNLLTVIKGYGEILLDALPEGDALSENMKVILVAADSAVNLTQQLLAFSRRQVIEPRVVNLRTLITRAQKMLCRIIGEDIHLETASGKNLGNVRVDPHQIDQLMVNLAANARDAMPDGGRLRIEMSNTVLDDAFCKRHPTARPGEYVLLTVSDTGCGMDEETKSRMFEPFFTTKEKGKGTGLGLSTVYGIVKQNNGFIDVQSEVCSGTEFRIYLPRAFEEVVVEERTREVQPATGEATILLVEDDAMVRNLAKLILIEHGYRVLDAEDGMKAMALCSEQGGDFRLLLTDVIMPNMSGKQLYDILKEDFPEIKVVYMSGYPKDIIAGQGVLDERTNFMQKPFSAETLVRRVQEALDAH